LIQPELIAAGVPYNLVHVKLIVVVPDPEQSPEIVMVAAWLIVGTLIAETQQSSTNCRIIMLKVAENAQAALNPVNRLPLTPILRSLK